MTELGAIISHLDSGEYHLAGSTGQDEFYFRGSLDDIEQFALDLIAQVKALREGPREP